MKMLQEVFHSFKNRPHGLVAVLLASIAIYPAVLVTTEAWNTPGDRYAHGWLVFAIALYVLSINNTKLQQTDPRFALLRYLAAFGGIATTWIAVVADISTIQSILVPFVFVLVGLALWGFKNVKVFIAPAIFLLFATPIWNPLNEYLREISTFMAGHIFSITGIPALVQGNYISLPSGSFHVAAGCSGFKYFITAISIATLYAYLFCQNSTRQVLLIIVAVLIAAITNWIRIVGVMLMGYYWGMEHPMVEDHDSFGWVLFGIAIMIYFVIAGHISDGKSKTQWIAETPAKVALKLNFIAILAILLPLILVTMISQAPARSSYALPSLDQLSPRPATSLIGWSLNEYKDEKDSLKASFGYGASTINLEAKTYDFLPVSANFLDYSRTIENEYWSATGLETNAAPDQVIETVVNNAGGVKVLVWSWYQINELITTSKLKVKIQRLKSFVKRHEGAAIWTLATKCQTKDCSLAAKRLNLLLVELGGSLTLQRRD